ncbi:MAG: AAA family ATPase [Deltaproteobacteria bacterium]|nr:AAA family ATPase [Deltaproteobacteria bacterium]
MITRIEIENFKGIAARQRIDFAPITLLFGANSAGKSTILQSLLYLHELLERGSADVDRTELGGGIVELGGFARLVHRHEISRKICLRVEFDTPDTLERFGRDLVAFPFPDLDDEVESAWMELSVVHRTTATFQGPIVERAVIGVNANPEPLVWLEVDPSIRDGEPFFARVNLGHPLIAEHVDADLVQWWEAISANEIVGDGGAGLGDGDGFGDGRSLPAFAIARSRNSAVPPLAEPLRVIPLGQMEELQQELARLQHENEQLRAGLPVDPELEDARVDLEARERAHEQARTFLEMIVLGTSAQLAASLREALYIGPLRTIPPRGFLYERVGRVTSWADGLAAWDLLLADRLTLVERTNAWLRRLGTGSQVVVQELFDRGADAEDLSSHHVDKTLRRLLLDSEAGLVMPSEVGAGISQVVPVVVAAVDEDWGLTLIEQPEIHVHPAVQVGLGDLFIDAVIRDGRRAFLVETHSEHLILRMLRRIRETTEKELAEGAPHFSQDKLSVLYIEATADGMQVRRLRVDERGAFLDPWPKGFFDERFAEVYGP